MATDRGDRHLVRPSLQAQSDERLTALAGAGSDEAFEVIVRRHRHALVRHCAGVLGEADAEEAVQEALLKAHAALRHGHAVKALAPWLHKIAHNTALSILGSRAARPTVADGGCECSSRTDEASLQREDFREVIDAIASLPPRQRDALVLHELDDRSYAEIATRLGASSAAVRQLLNRARCTLRTRLGAVTGIEPLLRWLSAGGSGAATARVGVLSGGCAATIKVCWVALLPAVGTTIVAQAPARQGARPVHVARAQTARNATVRVSPPAAVATRPTSTSTPTPIGRRGPLNSTNPARHAQPAVAAQPRPRHDPQPQPQPQQPAAIQPPVRGRGRSSLPPPDRRCFPSCKP